MPDRQRIDTGPLAWHCGQMPDKKTRIGIHVGLLITGALVGIACLVLMITGLASATLWFTVAAMVLLVISQGMTISRKRRGR